MKTLCFDLLGMETMQRWVSPTFRVRSYGALSGGVHRSEVGTHSSVWTNLKRWSNQKEVLRKNPNYSARHERDLMRLMLLRWWLNDDNISPAILIFTTYGINTHRAENVFPNNKIIANSWMGHLLTLKMFWMLGTSAHELPFVHQYVWHAGDYISHFLIVNVSQKKKWSWFACCGENVFCSFSTMLPEVW